MSDTFSISSAFLLRTLFDLYLYLLGIRFIMNWVRFDASLPVAELITRFTHPAITHVKRLIPNQFGIEWATLLVMLVLEFIKFFIITLLYYHIPNIFGLLFVALGDQIKIFCEIFFFSIVATFVISWLQPNSVNQKIGSI